MKSLKYYSLIVLVALFAVHTAGAQQQELSLQDALTRAVSGNPEIRASQLEVEKTRQQKVIARSLFLPTISASALASHYFQLPAFFGFGETTEDGKVPYGRFGGKDQLAAVVSAVQPLYNPEAAPSFQRAGLQERGGHLALAQKQLEVLSSIKQTYLRILVLDERIKVQRESIIRNQRALQDAKSLFLQGKGLRVDTLRAYTSVKNLEPELLKLSYAVEANKLQLKALVGMDSAQQIVLTDSLLVPAQENIPDETEVYNEAKKNNPDFQLLALQEQISAKDIAVASALRKPSLAAVGQYQVNSQTHKFEYDNAHYPSSSFVGLQLTVPLFTGLRTQAKVKQAAIAKEQSTLLLHHAHEQLRATVHEAIAGTRESMVRLQNTQVVKETAQLSYNIIQYRYKKGVSSRLELTDAELALSTAQSNYLEAVYDYLSARIVLHKLMGKVE